MSFDQLLPSAVLEHVKRGGSARVRLKDLPDSSQAALSQVLKIYDSRVASRLPVNQKGNMFLPVAYDSDSKEIILGALDSRSSLQVEDFVAANAFNKEVFNFLADAAFKGSSVVFCGLTFTGKSQLLALLLKELEERGLFMQGFSSGGPWPLKIQSATIPRKFGQEAVFKKALSILKSSPPAAVFEDEMMDSCVYEAALGLNLPFYGSIHLHSAAKAVEHNHFLLAIPSNQPPVIMVEVSGRKIVKVSQVANHAGVKVAKDIFVFNEALNEWFGDPGLTARTFKRDVY